MPRTNRAFDIRAKHPKRVHVDREMKKIRMKKAARDQLPHPEPDVSFELGHTKVANRPERERGQEPGARDGFQGENSDVDADKQSCESRHENSLTASANLHTKITKGHDGHNVAEVWFTTSVDVAARIAQLIIAREARATAPVKNCIGRCNRIPQAFSS